jgi:hypothetical protein
VLSKGSYYSLIAEGRMQGTPCRVTIDTGSSVTIAGLDIVAGYTERNFEFRLMQEVLESLGMSKTRNNPLHDMVERCVKTVEEHLRKVDSTHQRDWYERLPIFLLDYRASTHKTTGTTPASMVFGRGLRLPCDLLPPSTRSSPRQTTSTIGPVKI